MAMTETFYTMTERGPRCRCGLYFIPIRSLSMCPRCELDKRFRKAEELAKWQAGVRSTMERLNAKQEEEEAARQEAEQVAAYEANRGGTLTRFRNLDFNDEPAGRPQPKPKKDNR